jgi:hypothetical protein
MYRATRDLDLTAYLPDDEHELVRVIERICREPCPSDGIVFLLDTIRAESIRDESEYHGFRVHVDALLAGARVTLQVDAGFGNAIEPPAVETDYPTLLDAPAPRIRAYPREAVVAEKLHALVHRGAVNSRMKDFYDLFVLAARFDFKGPDLSRAISATFARRRTPVPATLPTGLSTPFFADPKRAAMWRSYLSRNGLPGAPAGFDAVGQSVRAFLWPPLMALAHGPAFSQNWTAGGPWR